MACSTSPCRSGAKRHPLRSGFLDPISVSHSSVAAFRVRIDLLTLRAARALEGGLSYPDLDGFAGIVVSPDRCIG